MTKQEVIQKLIDILMASDEAMEAFSYIDWEDEGIALQPWDGDPYVLLIQDAK